MRQKVANHKGDGDWIECGPRSPMGIGPMGEKHTKGGTFEDEPAYGIYFSTPGHRPLTAMSSEREVEVTYADV